MSVVTEKSGKMVPAARQKMTLEKALQDDRVKMQIANAVPGHIDPERMARIALTALRDTPKLSECSMRSFLGSVMTLAQLGLEPNTPLGHASLIPRKQKDGSMECTYIIEYQGYLELVYRSGMVALVYADVVRDGDVFDFDMGLDRKLIHKPIASDDNPLIASYAVAELTNGHKAFVVMTKSKIEKRRRHAQTQNIWQAYEEEMWKKTAIRQLVKYLPRSPELATAARLDEMPEYGASQTKMMTPEVQSSMDDIEGVIEEEEAQSNG